MNTAINIVLAIAIFGLVVLGIWKVINLIFHRKRERGIKDTMTKATIPIDSNVKLRLDQFWKDSDEDGEIKSYNDLISIMIDICDSVLDDSKAKPQKEGPKPKVDLTTPIKRPVDEDDLEEFDA